MANFIRLAKSGNDWMMNDLADYNIEVVGTDVDAFFGIPELPQTSISPKILNNLRMPDGDISNEERDFFLHLLSVETTSEESAVNDFAAALLRLLKYDTGRQCLIRTRMKLNFVMATKRVEAISDLCVIDDYMFTLLVQGDKYGQGFVDDVEPQLVAAAIAAFRQNNQSRSAVGLPKLTYKLMPGIAMLATAVVFYLIPITDALEKAVCSGYPAEERTRVLRLVPSAPDNCVGYGMRPLENRRIVMQCFEAFKKFLAN